MKTTASLFLNIACGVSLWLASGLASSQDITTLAPGGEVSGTLKLGANTVKLPAGTWRVLAAKQGTVGVNGGAMAGSRTTEAYLGVATDGVLTVGMTIGGTLSPSAVDRWSVDPCSVRPTLFKDDSGSRFTHPDCLYVRLVRGHLNNMKVQPYINAEKWVKDSNVKVPAAMLYVYYIKYAGGSYFVTTAYVSPAALGITEAEARNLKEPPDNLLAWARALKAGIADSVGSMSGTLTIPDIPF